MGSVALREAKTWEVCPKRGQRGAMGPLTTHETP
jgi:hypothetical protein